MTRPLDVEGHPDSDPGGRSQDGFHELAGAVVTAFDNAAADAPATFVDFHLLSGPGTTIELLG